jgi:very-short-patch-repair endonuclease
MKSSVPPIAIERARAMRRNPTDAEQGMWRNLRTFFPQGRWRRQVPLAGHIADFASHALRIVIEVDGGQHEEARDAFRTRRIEREGYTVIRFWNNDMLENPAGCMARLADILGKSHPHPTAPRRAVRAKASYPSPIKGEEA